MRTVAIILIVAGALMMAITGFNYVTREEVADIGPLEINKEESHPVRWSPILGGVLLLGGIVLLVSSKRSKI